MRVNYSVTSGIEDSWLNGFRVVRKVLIQVEAQEEYMSRRRELEGSSRRTCNFKLTNK